MQDVAEDLTRSTLHAPRSTPLATRHSGFGKLVSL